VLIHDAINYVITKADLRAAIQTAAMHLRPGGYDAEDGDGVRYLE
jgi:hypothetical protein